MNVLLYIIEKGQIFLLEQNIIGALLFT